MLHEVSENLLVPHQGLNVKGEGRDEAVGGGWGKFSSEAYVKKHQMPFGYWFWCESSFDQILVHIPSDRVSVGRDKHFPLHCSSAQADSLKQARIHITLISSWLYRKQGLQACKKISWKNTD